MGYRKIHVRGIECEWTAGKSSVHIKIPGQKPLNYKVEEVGETYDWKCECCGESLNVLYPDEPHRFDFGITPKVVRRLIETHLNSMDT